MQPPTNTALPFFAYGIFKPGQLGFHRLKDLVEESKRQCTIPGTLLIRDGLPIIDPAGSGEVRGDLLIFRSDSQAKAYERIAEIEPDKHYRWGTAISNGVEANALFGRSPRKGAVACEESEWDGRNDPLFTSALEVVEEALKTNSDFDWNLKPLFRLQMAYLLLWSSIERYVSLRYHLGDKVMEKVNCLAQEKAFCEGLRQVVKSKREVFRADRPDKKITLDPSNLGESFSKNSLDYYYQIRSNITHRGKAVVKDHERVKDSLSELLLVFRDVLTKGFEEST